MKKPKSSRRTVLTIDVGGSHVKVMTNKEHVKRAFASGPRLSAKAMAKKAKELTRDWSYDVVSVGYPGPVVHNCPVTEPHNPGKGWVGFNFEEAFKRPNSGSQ